MLLEAAEIPVPRGTVVRTEVGLDEAIAKFGYPLVIKPIDGNHGKGNTTNITDREQAIKALEAAKNYGNKVIVERFITGYDFRCLVINHKFIFGGCGLFAGFESIRFISNNSLLFIFLKIYYYMVLIRFVYYIFLMPLYFQILYYHVLDIFLKIYRSIL